MNDNNFERTDFHLWIDIPFILRLIKKWIFCMLCIAICAGVLGYIGSDLLTKDRYTITELVSVLPKKNTESAFSDYSMGSALTRSVNMWNSNVLNRKIREKNVGINVNSTLHASGDNKSFLISLSVSAASAEEAYRIMNTAIHSYTEISDNFDQNYRDVVLSCLSEDSLSVRKKKPVLYGLLGFAGSLALMVLVLAGWSMVTDVVHNEEQAKAILNLTMIEALPYVKKKREQKRLLIGDSNIPNDYMEAVDKMTTRIEQQMLQKKQKIIMFASLKENEGKTTVAANFAVNLARRGNKTLLVEMDFRNTSLYRFFGEKKSDIRNISSVLQEEGSLKDAVRTRSDEWGLDLLWQFKQVDDSDHFLENSMLREQLISLAEAYDYIVLDTPPLSGFRDADVIAQICDTSVLIIRRDCNISTAENEVADILAENGAPCIGFVLNQGTVKKRKGRSGYNALY